MVNIGTVSELHIIGHLKKINIFMVFCIDQFANKHTRFGDKDERVFGMFLRFLKVLPTVDSATELWCLVDF